MGKATGPTGVSAEQLKNLDNEGIEWFRDILRTIVHEGEIPEEWKKSYIVPIYKVKEEPLECKNHRGIKLLEHGGEEGLQRRVLEWQEQLQKGGLKMNAEK